MQKALQTFYNNTIRYKQKICKIASSFNKKSNSVESIFIPYSEYLEYAESLGIINYHRTQANLGLVRDIRTLKDQMMECYVNGTNKIDSNIELSQLLLKKNIERPDINKLYKILNANDE